MRQKDLKEALPVAIVNGGLAPFYLLQACASHRMIASRADGWLSPAKLRHLR